jgi:hypothetical protein
MIIAVGTMGVVEVPTYQIIKVVPVWRAFMPAAWAMSMCALVSFARVVGRAAVRVGATHRNGVLIDVFVMGVMQVTIMKIVRVTIMYYRRVPAIGVVHVTMGRVHTALTFFHTSILSH